MVPVLIIPLKILTLNQLLYSLLDERAIGFERTDHLSTLLNEIEVLHLFSGFHHPNQMTINNYFSFPHDLLQLLLLLMRDLMMVLLVYFNDPIFHINKYSLLDSHLYVREESKFLLTMLEVHLDFQGLIIIELLKILFISL